MRSCGTVVQEDNQAAIQLTENEAVTQRSRHINVKYHWLRDLVRDGSIVIEYCPTSHMVAYTLTKALGRVKFDRFRQLLGIQRVGVLEPVCAMCAGFTTRGDARWPTQT